MKVCFVEITPPGGIECTEDKAEDLVSAEHAEEAHHLQYHAFGDETRCFGVTG